MPLRPYQQECIDIIDSLIPGAYLVQMATGLGKTYTFANIRRQGRVLILSHREELVRQPEKYYDCSFGIEQAGSRSHGEDIVSASVQTIVRRLNKFNPFEFDVIICDEAHHAAAKTYRKIFDYFRPRLLLGFTATPSRSDNVRLDTVFNDIIFERDLRFGIENGYLSDIFCRRVDIGYDLSSVHTRCGDYAPGELDRAMDGTADAIAQAYRELASGATLIFASSVRHAEEIAKKIDGAVTVTGETKNRADIIKAFTEKKIPCLVNCMVFTEGTDMPLVETVMIARPTQSDSLYAQMVGRGLRLHPDKEKLNLIDCVGITGKANLCTAPSLLGIDIDNVPESKKDKLQGDLFELPQIAVAESDCPQSWIKNVEIVDLWAKRQSYDTHGVNWFKMPDGSLILPLPELSKPYVIPCADKLGRVPCKDGTFVSMQQALDTVYKRLMDKHTDSKYIWDLKLAKRWGREEASDKQKNLIKRRCKGIDVDSFTKLEASQILNRVMYKGA